MSELLGGGKPKGPSEAEKQMQRDRETEANRANADEDKKLALVSRAKSLRRSLSYQGSENDTIGG